VNIGKNHTGMTAFLFLRGISSGVSSSERPISTMPFSTRAGAEGPDQRAEALVAHWSDHLHCRASRLSGLEHEMFRINAVLIVNSGL
jgi:hypothetical protein